MPIYRRAPYLSTGTKRPPLPSAIALSSGESPRPSEITWIAQRPGGSLWNCASTMRIDVDLAVDSNGRILVLDRGSNAVRIFEKSVEWKREKSQDD